MNRMKNRILPGSISLLFILAFEIPAATQPMESVIKARGIEMMRAFTQKNFTEFIRYIHPKLIEMGGGQEKLLKRLDTAGQIATRMGATLKKITIGNPYKIVSYRNELQATLPQTSDFSFLNGNISLETTLIAISRDNGKTWYFIDTSLYGMGDLKKNLPDLSPDLVIPPRKAPVITANDQ